MEEKTVTPAEYFENLKGKVKTMTDKDLKVLYNNALELSKKYVTTGQEKGLKKIMFHLQTIAKEKQLLDLGINKFVYKDDIEEYIEDIASNQVCIIELKNYEREVPDEIVESVEKTRDIFDEFYVVFTDYTGKVSRQVQQERREKDPILFGAFLDEKEFVQNDRFYFIGDWQDAYCDLTLDKLISEMKKEAGRNIEHDLMPIPKTKEELAEQLNSLELDGNNLILKPQEEKKEGIFSRVRTFFSKLTK